MLPSTPVVITYDGVPVANGTTESTGAYRVSFAVPASPRGAHTVRANDGVNSPSAIFTVTSSITRSATGGAVGSVVTLWGSGFLASNPITIKWDGTIMTTTPSSIVTDSNGSFVAAFLAPSGAPITHTIQAIDTTSITTTYLLSRSISLSPTSGYMGDNILVTGTGFLAWTPINLTLGSDYLVTVPTNIITDALGEFSAAFTIPDILPGSKSVKATESVGGSASASLTLISNLTLNYYSGDIGTSVRITGYGFTPLDNVTVTYDGAVLLITDTDSIGYFRRTFVVPPSSAGPHSVIANDTGGKSTNTTFTVTPNIGLSATSGSVGAAVTVTGTGYTAMSPINVSFGNITLVTTPSTIQTDSLGNFFGTFIVPQMSPNSWGVMARDVAGSYDEATFTIIRKLSLSSTSGYAGSNMTVRGTDFSPLTVVTLTFDSTTLVTDPASLTTDSQGRFIGTFIVPEALNGYHTLFANDSTGGLTSLSFYVGSLIGLNPSNGNNGTEVLVTGTGFGPNSLVYLTFDNLPVVTAPSPVQTNSAGSFSAQFTVTSNAAGAHTVRATDLFGNTDTDTFTVIRQITPSDSTVYVLQAITITGVGFNGSSTISFTWDGSPITLLPESISSDTSGGFSAMLTVPLGVSGPHTIMATDGDGNSASTNATIYPSITLMPEGQIVGDRLWIRGDGFAGSDNIEVAWDGVNIATDPITLTTDSDGSFNGSFIVPPSYFGAHRVTASDQQGHATSSSYTITLTSNLNIVIDVGPLYFPGEVAEFYILCAQAGKPFNASTMIAKLYGPGGSWEDLSPSLTCIETGTYRVDYTLLGNSTPGSYALVSNVSKDFSGVTYYGSDLRVFEVSGTFEEMNATLVSINDTLASISIDIGPVLLRLDQINASLSSLITGARGDILAAISTASGTIVSRLDLLDASVSSMSDGIATINSSLGTIQVNLTAIGAKLTSMEGTMANISTVLGTINVSINDLNPRLTAIENGVLVIQTDLGEVQLALSDLQARAITAEGDHATIETGMETITATLEGLTGIAVPIETLSGTYMGTIFTNTQLTSAGYAQSTQSISIACQCSGSPYNALSVVLPKAVLDQLHTSPASFKLVVGTQETPFTLVNASDAYIIQTSLEQGSQAVVLYLNGLPPPFSSLTLLALALAALLVVGVAIVWVRKRRKMNTAIPWP